MTSTLVDDMMIKQLHYHYFYQISFSDLSGDDLVGTISIWQNLGIESQM